MYLFDMVVFITLSFNFRLGSLVSESKLRDPRSFLMLYLKRTQKRLGLLDGYSTIISKELELGAAIHKKSMRTIQAPWAFGHIINDHQHQSLAYSLATAAAG